MSPLANGWGFAREAGVSRTMVDKYFQIIEETLIGFRLPALSEGIKTKEVQHPKFYLFDSGVARACAGQLGDDYPVQVFLEKLFGGSIY